MGEIPGLRVHIAQCLPAFPLNPALILFSIPDSIKEDFPEPSAPLIIKIFVFLRISNPDSIDLSRPINESKSEYSYFFKPNNFIFSNYVNINQIVALVISVKL